MVVWGSAPFTSGSVLSGWGSALLALGSAISALDSCISRGAPPVNQTLKSKTLFTFTVNVTRMQPSALSVQDYFLRMVIQGHPAQTMVCMFEWDILFWLIYIAGDGLRYGYGLEFLSCREVRIRDQNPSPCLNTSPSLPM